MRLADKPITNASELADTLARILVHALDRPFAFFGHSMGALLAFEVSHLLHARHGLLPEYLFASAAPAPHLPVKHPGSYNLPESELIARLVRLNGTPDEVLNNPELRALLLPVIRADFSVVDTYVYTPRPKLNVPICAVGGSDDPEISQDELRAWKKETSGPFTLDMLPGDHFFLHTGQRSLLELIAKRLNPAVRAYVPQAAIPQGRG
jgi:medium-chain acyl-[acyl-carrier-protein] hydrolase